MTRAVRLILVCLLAVATPALSGPLDDLTGELNVANTTFGSFLSVEGRRLYAGDKLTLTISGAYVLHRTRTEESCFLFFCHDEVVPTPVTVNASQYPPMVLLVDEATSERYPGFPTQGIQVGSIGYTFTIPADGDFARRWVLHAWIPDGPNFERAIATGIYRLRLQVDSTPRLDAFRNFLSQPRTADEIRAALDVRFKTQHGPAIAAEIANHAQTRYGNGSNGDELANCLTLAQDIDPGSFSIQNRLAQYYISESSYAQAQTAAIAAVNNAADDADRGQAYVRLGEVAEFERTPVAGGALHAAAAFYERAETFARAAHDASGEIAALVANARVLRSMRTAESLKRAADILSRAMERSPVEFRGALLSDTTANAGKALLTHTQLAFRIAGATTSKEIAVPGDDAVPLAVSGGRVLVQESNGSVVWLDPTSRGLTLVGTARVVTALTSGTALLGMTQASELVFMAEDRSQRSIAQGTPRTFSAGQPQTGEPIGPFGLAAEGERMFWITLQSRKIHVQSFTGENRPDITLPEGEPHGAAISADGRQLAVVSATAGSGGTLTFRIKLYSLETSAPTPVSVLNESNAELQLEAFGGELRSVSFSPDGGRLLVNAGPRLVVVDVATRRQTHSFDLSATATPGLLPAWAHTWVSPTQAVAYHFPDPTQGADTEKRTVTILSLPEGTISTTQVSFASTFPVASGLPVTTGALLLPEIGAPSLALLGLLPSRRIVADVISLPDAVVAASKMLDPLPPGLPLSLVRNGRTIAIPTQPANLQLVDLEASDTPRRVSGLAFPLRPQDVNGDEWQVIEPDAQNVTTRVRRFRGLEATDTFSFPPLPAAETGLYAAGGACAPLQGALPPTPLVWAPYLPLNSPVGRSATPAPVVWNMAQTPNYFGQFQYTIRDFPYWDTSRSLPLETSSQRFLSCATIVDWVPGVAAVQLKSAPVTAPFQSPPSFALVLVNNGASAALDLLQIQPGTPVPTPPNVTGRFSPEGRDFSVVVSRQEPNRIAHEIRVWRIESGVPLPRACPPCAKVNSSRLEAKLLRVDQRTNPAALPAPGRAPGAILSTSGKSIAIVADDELIVYDVDSDRIRLRLSVELPILLTDDVLITRDDDMTLQVWKL